MFSSLVEHHAWFNLPSVGHGFPEFIGPELPKQSSSSRGAAMALQYCLIQVIPCAGHLLSTVVPLFSTRGEYQYRGGDRANAGMLPRFADVQKLWCAKKSMSRAVMW